MTKTKNQTRKVCNIVNGIIEKAKRGYINLYLESAEKPNVHKNAKFEEIDEEIYWNIRRKPDVEGRRLAIGRERFDLHLSKKGFENKYNEIKDAYEKAYNAGLIKASWSTFETAVSRELNKIIRNTKNHHNKLSEQVQELEDVMAGM